MQLNCMVLQLCNANTVLMKFRLLFWSLSIVMLHIFINTVEAQTVTIGTGTSSSYLYGPYYRSSATSSFNYSRYAILYTASELGIPTGSIITQVEWYKVSGTLTGNNVFNILMKNTTATSLTSGSTWGSLTSGSTSVYASTTKSFTVTGNWESITLANPFVYTGGSLLIFTDHHKQGTASGSNNFRYTSASGKSIGYASSAAPSSSSTLTTTYGNNRPNIRITYTPGCTMPSVATHPVSTSACIGANTSFSVSSTTTNPIYQWQMSTNGGSSWNSLSNGGIYTGATTQSLSLTNLPSSVNGYKYRCVIAASCTTGTATSNAATLTINTLPAFSGNPINTTICAGANASFSVSASGTGITYQWQLNSGSGFSNITNGGVYAGSASATLNVSNVNTGMNGYQYRCYVTGTCSPSAASTTATLNVNPATAIITHPSDVTVCPSSNVAFGITASGNSLTYQWQQSVNNGVSWTNLFNNSPYGNATTSTLNITGAPSLMNGYKFRCIVNGTCSGTQVSNQATLNINNTIPISSSGQPQNVVTCFNTNVNFTVVAASSGVNYQWQVNSGSGFSNVVNGGAYSGATSATLSLSGVPLSLNGTVYRCVVSNSCVVPFNTNSALLTVNSYPGISTQPAAVTSCEGVNTSFSVTGTGLGISYQWQVSSGSGFVNLSATAPGYNGQLSNTVTILNPSVSLNGNQYRCIVNGQCAPPAISNSAILTIQGRPMITIQPTDNHMCVGSNANFSLNATGFGLSYQWQMNSGSGFSNIFNGSLFAGTTTNSLSVNTPPSTMFATSFRCIVSGTCSPVAVSSSAQLYVNTAPIVVSQPTDKTICEGSATSFSVQANANSSLSPITYQWQVNSGAGFVNISNGTPYSGATTNTLSITPGTLIMDGFQYRCLVNASCSPSATTNTVGLKIQAKPVVTKHPQDVTSCPSTVATFEVAGTGTSLYYKWQENKGSGFVNLSDNTVYSGSTSPKLNIVVAPSMNNWQYRCVLISICTPSKISNTAKLTALNPVVINSHSLSDTVCEGATSKIGLSASGASLKYQWQRKIATGNYVDLVNVPPYSGVNTDSLRFTNIPDSIKGYAYRCRVYEMTLCGQSFYTADIPLEVNLTPDVYPETVNTNPGKTAIFTVPANGISYEWQENSHDGGGYKSLANSTSYSGVNTNTLSISPATQLMNGNQYRCIVDGICKYPTVSSIGTLVVHPYNVGVASVNTEGLEIKLYPNPIKGTRLNIESGKAISGITEIRIFDKIGRLVHTSSLDLNNATTGSIELPELSQGIYMLHIINKANNISRVIQFIRQE